MNRKEYGEWVEAWEASDSPLPLWHFMGLNYLEYEEMLKEVYEDCDRTRRNNSGYQT